MLWYSLEAPAFPKKPFSGALYLGCLQINLLLQQLFCIADIFKYFYVVCVLFDIIWHYFCSSLVDILSIKQLMRFLLLIILH